MQGNEFKGIWLPENLLLDENLTLQEKVILADIVSLNKKGVCFASNEHFARHIHLSTSRVSSVISSLKKKGYVTIEFNYSGKQITSRTIRVVNGGEARETGRKPFDIEIFKRQVSKIKDGFESDTVSKFIGYVELYDSIIGMHPMRTADIGEALKMYDYDLISYDYIIAETEPAKEHLKRCRKELESETLCSTLAESSLDITASREM